MVYIHPSQYVNKKLYWNRSVYRDREVMANRPGIIIKKTNRGKVQTDRCGNTSGKECHAEGSRKEKNYKSLLVGIQGMCTMLVGTSGIAITCLKNNLEDMPKKKH